MVDNSNDGCFRQHCDLSAVLSVTDILHVLMLLLLQVIGQLMLISAITAGATFLSAIIALPSLACREAHEKLSAAATGIAGSIRG